MRGLAGWCISHRRIVIVVWLSVAIVTTVLARSIGPRYASVFSLPGTESQRASDLLVHGFKAQSGDIDTVVFRVSSGTIDSTAVRSTMEALLARAAALPHVAGVVSPYGRSGATQVAPDRHTAYATVVFDRPQTFLPAATGAPLLRLVDDVHVPDLAVAAGGPVIEAAQGFSIGPATEVGVVAALLILLVTFGSLAAAGMPLVTAGVGLVTGIALIELGTRVTDIVNIAPDLALMIGLGVGIDYSLFVLTRFRETYLEVGDVRDAILTAMDTSGRAIVLAGATVVIALLGMFATGVAFMYGLAIAAVIAVLLTLLASLTLLPALLSLFGRRLVRPRAGPRRLVGHRPLTGAAIDRNAVPRSVWRRWSETVQRHPWPLALGSLTVMVCLAVPVLAIQLENSDAGNDPAALSSRHAFDLLAAGFGPGFNGPLLLVVELPHRDGAGVLPRLRATLAATAGVVAVTPARTAPSGTVAVVEAIPSSAPQDSATTGLVDRLRSDVLPTFERHTGVTVLVGGFTAGSIDFSHLLAGKLPLFLSLVILLSALLLLVIFRSLVIPLQAALMNLLTIGSALGVTVAVFQWGWFAGLLGVQKGPIEPWIPVILFAVVFGLSMDYEVFLVSRVREQWVRNRDASHAVSDGIALTGRVISAAAAIMVCVFLSFTLGNEVALKEFGFGLAIAIFLDALVVRCIMLPACLELIGAWTWRLPTWLDRVLPRVGIEGAGAGLPHTAVEPDLDDSPVAVAPAAIPATGRP